MKFLSRSTVFAAALTLFVALLFVGNALAADPASKSDILGKWNLDPDAMKKVLDEQVAAGKAKKEQVEPIKSVMSSMKMSFEFKEDGTLAFVFEGGPSKQSKEGTWSLVSAKDNTLTLNTKVDNKSEEVTITVIGKDAIAIHPPKNERSPFDRLPLKRAKE